MPLTDAEAAVLRSWRRRGKIRWCDFQEMCFNRGIRCSSIPSRYYALAQPEHFELTDTGLRALAEWEAKNGQGS